MSLTSSATPFEWLPMPSGISLTGHSFTDDLLKQFDNRRRSLIDDNDDVISIPKSVEHSIIVASLPIVESRASSTSSIQAVASDDTASKQSEKPRDLQRKSSVHLRNKFNDGFHHHPQTEQQIEQPRASTLFNSWTLKRKKKFHHVPTQDITFNQSEDEPLSKIAIHTTIHMNPVNHQPAASVIQPPVITQYPPKPLKYSPVEPLPTYAGTDTDTSHTTNTRRKTLQRLSLPLLKLTASSQPARTIQRRRSDSDLLNQPTPPVTKNLFRSISKRWSKLICTCKNRGIRKK
ncbi:uncharacterized protein EV154DRAFT_203340 [Mucor mucedo]|uniref:uncharacterized protein n=1 Tax=Mucor mucedo TaxID=29922 RepID=UPI00222046F5|nr:uncharacterized protein EV154DRAFT_203340 [Mucor mucedo]KAI7892072.1 hypothetical protein EV154DRAFT_203340 [Mucor mucedo]